MEWLQIILHNPVNIVFGVSNSSGNSHCKNYSPGTVLIHAKYEFEWFCRKKQGSKI